MSTQGFKSNGFSVDSSGNVNVGQTLQGGTASGNTLFDVSATGTNVMRIQRFSTGDIQILFGDAGVDITLKNGGHVEVNGYVRPGTMAASSAVNNSIFIDSADNNLKFKNSSGVVKTITMA